MSCANEYIIAKRWERRRLRRLVGIIDSKEEQDARRSARLRHPTRLPSLCTLRNPRHISGIGQRGDDHAPMRERRRVERGVEHEDVPGRRRGDSAGAATSAEGEGREHSTRNLEPEDSKVFSAWAKRATRVEGRRAICDVGFALRRVREIWECCCDDLCWRTLVCYRRRPSLGVLVIS
ncbi:hypothetical protein NUW58_g6790 [Xylaria curta]|uniref:Uncharacterized protein n=1 Tax=Xylaria curta TaxID=42375 RepID=A0ACC1NRR5_9PEZI|nr:hypothetical protein NUW58_g6790 [Xylaria curta]